MTPAIAMSAQASAEVKPVWLKVADAVKASGVSRSRLYEWITAGNIRSVCVRERHQKKGTRLIKAESLWAFLESMAEGGQSK